MVKANTILTRQDWETQRQSAQKDPGKFHGDIAKREIFWYAKELDAWVKQVQRHEGLMWVGIDAKTGKILSHVPLSKDYTPWQCSFNEAHPPFYGWFEGGFTNACFNEVDAHVIAGRGAEIAFIFEGDRWDSTLNSGRGGSVNQQFITRKQLLWEVVKRAEVLRRLGLQTGDRIAINMPNILEQIFFTEAAKRLGIIYTPVFGGFSAKTLSDRIHDAGAKVVITSDGAYRNAQVVNFKENFTDKALDSYIPAAAALERLAKILEDIPEVNSAAADEIVKTASAAFKGEITLEPSDLMRIVGNAIEAVSQKISTGFSAWNAAAKSKTRIAIAEALVQPLKRVEKVIVVKHVNIDNLAWNPARDLWAHELVEAAAKDLLQAMKKECAAQTEEELLALSDEQFIQAIYSTIPAVPVESEFPLFIVYTSGSTGKPKGIVHVHGGYVAGIAHTMRIAFDIPERPFPEDPINLPEQKDVIYVVADPGWITGQSYMISAALTTATTSIIAEGSPLFPHAGCFASIIERHHVTVFKAGSTFLKAVAADPQNILDVENYDRSSLRVASFCAEPTSPAIQAFAMQLLTPCYINSYWATEHGGIILTHFFGNSDFPLKADAQTFPLPWIFADVWIASEKADGQELPKKHAKYLVAKEEEKGELVITKPYPYLARTIWGDGDNVGKPGWKGDAVRYQQIYFDRWRSKNDASSAENESENTSGTKPEGTSEDLKAAKPGETSQELAFTLGDYACKHAGGGFTLHGRSDDVINTSGHRIGTEEIEGALLKEKQINPQGPVGNVIVVGAPHHTKGTVPVAFLQIQKNQKLTLADERRLIGLVREEKGAIAVPAGFITVSQFPETRSGKYLRRYLQNILEGTPLGDTSALRNPECLTEIRTAILRWQHKIQLEDSQSFLQTYATLRVEYHALPKGETIALITLDKPPVNALDERSLDELHLVADHLDRREDVRVVILTGAGTKSFVAGADIRQLLEEMHAARDVLPLSHAAAQVTQRFERMSKPVIVAINGLALGGGNEFQMAAHYRIAEPTALFGQPEINLHLIPGYGATQRLPRLLAGAGGEEGFIEAMHIILGGRSISAERALQIGLIHEVVSENDALTRAFELARQYVDQGEGPLAQAYRSRLDMVQQWEAPQRFPMELFESNAELQNLCAQLKSAGRALPLEWALDAMRFGYENGFIKGLEREAHLFAEAVVHPLGGKMGIQAFFDRQSAPLPLKRTSQIDQSLATEKSLLASGKLLPTQAPFFPGFTPLPEYQYAYLVEKDAHLGSARHGDPIQAECKRIIPVSKCGPQEVLLYMLTSEVNFNDIWAITGVPVSPFDSHDEDWHVTGSGGLGLVAAAGTEVRKEGRIKLGDLVAVFSGQSDLLSPLAGLDPMFADQTIQGYETPDGSHQQFMTAQAPQVHAKLPDLTLEAAGSYMLNLGTIYRALFTTLKIKSGKTLFVEGAATGTGLEAVKAAARCRLKVIGMVSSQERAQTVLHHGGVGSINRRDPRYVSLFTPVPENPAEWAAWESAGLPLIEDFKAQNNGKLADYVLSHAGQESFPRSFQLLEPGGTLAFFGGTSGYHFTFMGKAGALQPEEMLLRAQLAPGESVLIFYGSEDGTSLDEGGLECIEAAKELGAKIAICTWNESQREIVHSMGFGKAIQGIFSIEELKHRKGAKFAWPKTMPALPNSKDSPKEFKEAVRWYQEFVFKPFASQVGALLKSASNPKGMPDIIVERAAQDSLCLSTMLVKPHTGRVVYFEDMSERRYSFYAPQVWMRQRKICMPAANIWGTHLSNAYEIYKMNQLIDGGLIQVSDPVVLPFDDLPKGHQEMWENRHRGANYVLNHALPQLGLKTKDELYLAWSAAKMEIEKL